MATSSVSSTSVNGSNFITALGTGSGIDIKTLATNLVEAEKQPKAALIQRSIDKSTAEISGYSIVANAIGQIQSSLDALGDPKLYSSFTTSSSQPSAVSLTAGLGAQPGTHRITIDKLAQAQRSVSNFGFTSGVSVGAAFSITFSTAPSTFVSVTDTTPEGIVRAVNAAKLGITASLVDTGDTTDPLRIVLSGTSGAGNSFSVSTGANGPPLGFLDPASSDATEAAAAIAPPNLKAQDASLTVDGIPVTRSSNTVSGVIPGVTINLLDTTTAGSSAVVSLARDTSEFKTTLQQLVSNYNDTQAIIDAAVDPKSQVEKLGGSLAGISAVRSIRDQVRRILLPETNPVSDPDAALSDLRQFGLFVDQDGRMKFSSINKNGTDFNTTFKVGDTTMLDNQLASRFDEVRSLFLEKDVVIGRYGANNAELHRAGIARGMADQFGGGARGVDAFKTAGQPATSTPLAMLTYLQSNEQSQIGKDEQRLADLNDRMSRLLEGYIKQFAAMDSLVGQSRSVQSGIENSFKGMSNSK